MGFSVPPRLRLERWALTPPFHPYPHLFRNAGGLSFCGTIRWPASRQNRPRVSQLAFLRRRLRLRGIAPYGVRTFLPPELLRGSDPPPFQNQPHHNPYGVHYQERTASEAVKKLIPLKIFIQFPKEFACFFAGLPIFSQLLSDGGKVSAIQ
jgi:hypothetical protein